MTRLLIYIFVAAMAAVASAQGLTARDGAKAYSKHLEYLDSNPDSAAYYMGEAARLMPDSAAMQIMAGKYFADCQGDYARAMDYFSRAMGLAQQQYGANSIAVADCYINIADLLAATADYDRAVRYYQQALKIYNKTTGDKEAKVAICYNNIANAYKGKGDFENAQDYYRKALKIFRQTEGKRGRVWLCATTTWPTLTPKRATYTTH